MKRFPAGFVWGAATASYQIEGSPLADGAGASIWHRFAHTPGTIAQADHGDVACDHYRRWPDDVALMADLGLNAYRFSIAWPRVFPEGRGKVNGAGLDFYDRLVDALCDRGIAPFVTLYHWDIPGALQDLGGWCNRDVAGWFADYAAAVYARLGDRVRHWITLNEPWVVAFIGHLFGIHAPGMKDLWATMAATHHLLLAHGQAVEAFRASGHPGEIGITLNLSPQEPASESEDDVAAADRQDAILNRLFADPVFLGRYPEVVTDRLGHAMPAIESGDFGVIARPIDFVGVNYYTRNLIRHAPGTGVVDARWAGPRGPVTSMGWEIYPEGLTATLRWVADRYGNPRQYVTESGAAFPDSPDASGFVQDDDRIDYLRAHFAAALEAIDAGVRLDGYFVWSLLDNFEWSFGYQMRFGLVRTDYETQARVVKATGHWYRSVIEAGAVDA